MHLMPNMYKIVTLKAHAKDIVTLKCICHHICANHYFEGKCSENHYFNMHLTPNMYKIVTLEANAKKIITWKMHLMPNMYKIMTLKANAKEIVTVKRV